jgi:Malectin domain/Pectate lyase superfamily protein
MTSTKSRIAFTGWLLTFTLAGALRVYAQEEFVGPFPSWANVKSDYGARGDGNSDDTAALQNALNDLGNSRSVLYLPAGVYKITGTLNLTYKIHASVIGQDPASTIIKWGGPQGATMLLVNGVTQSKWARITWDGSGVAGVGVAHQWDRAGGYAPTNLEHADEIFQNLGKGLVGGGPGGANDDSITITRSKFSNCSLAGVSVESFNALNYWIWDSQFINNARGVTNEFGAGNFAVYRSLFQNSRVADITIVNTEYFAFRGNTSIGSQQFFHAANVGQNSAPVTIQGNRIIDTVNPIAIDVGNLGTLTLLDNQIRTKQGASGPAVQLSSWASGADVISVGNFYTVNNPVSVVTPAARWWTQDDQVVAFAQIDGSVPAMPGTPPNLNRTVFDVGAGNAAGVQQAVNQAAQLTGQRPVVHIPRGQYNLTQTITVPANSDMQIVGDGYGSNLSSSNAGGTTVLLNGPSKVILRDLGIYANNGTAVEIGNPDQPGSRVLMNGVLEEVTTQNNLLAENLLYTNIDMQSHQLGYLSGSSIKVIGAGGAGTSRVGIFGATTGADTAGRAPMFEITNGGRILAEDTWYEGGSSRLIYATDSGVFTGNGLHIAPTPDAPQEPVINVSGFNGVFTLLGSEFDFHGINRSIQVGSENSNTNVFIAGLDPNQQGYFSRLSSGGYLNFINNKVCSGSGCFQVPDQGDPRTAQFVRTALNQLRNEKSVLPATLPAGTTDVKLYRLDIKAAAVGVHLKSSGQSQPATGGSAIRVNAGGPGLTDSLGQNWSADTGFSGGTTFANSTTVSAPSNSSQASLYQTERYGNFIYQFGVPNGTYKVTLKFAEIYWSQPNQRLFSVAINGAQVLSNFDILAQAGGPFIAVDRSFTVTVSGGQLSLAFTTQRDNAKIDAIEILPQP